MVDGVVVSFGSAAPLATGEAAVGACVDGLPIARERRPGFLLTGDSSRPPLSNLKSRMTGIFGDFVVKQMIRVAFELCCYSVSVLEHGMDARK